tara:strand:+ start:233 stop:541 length:309 start_codon:yes stop_codon:yes gene_type:complete
MNGNYEKGAKIFKTKCSSCHSIEKDNGSKPGPNLYKIFGTQLGQNVGYSYSSAFKTKNIIWNDETLYEFLTNPKKYIPGTKMVFAGIKKEQDKRDVIEYLKR